MGKVSISYTNEIVNAEERAYLRTLPSHIRLEYQLNGVKRNILFVHGVRERLMSIFLKTVPRKV